MSFKIVLQILPIALLVLVLVGIFIPAFAPYPNSSARVDEYNAILSKTAGDRISADNPLCASGLRAFETFLTKIGDKEYVRENTAKVYTADAYLNDTLVTHYGTEEIMSYFHKTADTMTSYKVTIDDTASSGSEHYVRWTMVFSAPKLNGGKPVSSIGMSHVRINSAGLVTMHQDYWDSGLNIYGQIPVIGGVIETIRRRLEK